MSDFRRLKVWERSHDLVLAVYRTSSRFPSNERFGLTAQIRRGALSIPSNIAEGCGRRGDGEFRRFLAIAMGSSYELEYQVLLARDLGFVSEDDYGKLMAAVREVGRMLSSLLAKVSRSAKGGKTIASS